MALAAALVWAGCAGVAPPADLASAAVAARGGPLTRFARASDLDVYAGFEGAWQWEVGFEAPERLRLTIETAAEAQTLVSDGVFVRTYSGNALVSELPARGSDVATLVSFVALSGLDVLMDARRAVWESLDAGSLPAGTAQGLRARLQSTPDAAFDLGFDGDLRLVRIAGPVSIPGIGEGLLEARFEGFRSVGRYVLPFAIHYRFRGAPLLDERVREWKVGEAASEPGSFLRPLP